MSGGPPPGDGSVPAAGPESAEGPAIQDFYPDDAARCYGCGRLNEAGHRLRTRWEGEETVSRFTPEDHHTALPGFVYGGLVASLLDCHGTGTAAGAAARADGWDPASGEPPEGGMPRYVTARLEVDFAAPTPLGPELVVRGRVVERGERKIVVEETLEAGGEVTARGRVVAVRMPESLGRDTEG